MHTLFSRAAAGIAIACVTMFGQIAVAAPPAAPAVDYFSKPKHVRFQWNYVPQANYYELWWKPNAGAAAVKMAERPSWNPRWDALVATHLLDWSETRWEVKACNPSGCTGSGLINIGSTIVYVPGFFIAPAPTSGERYGHRVAIAAPGNTVAVANAAGDIHVYDNAVPGNLRLTDVVAAPDAAFPIDMRLALSQNGSVLVASYPSEYWGAPGVPENERGAVYVYRLSLEGGAHYALEKRFADLDKLRQGGFASLSEDGTVLAYSYWEDETTPQARHVAIYRRGASGWVLEKDILDSQTAFFCHDQRTLSGDGKTYARRCIHRNATNTAQQARIDVFAAPGWTLRDSFVIGEGPDFVNYGPVVSDYTGNTLAAATWTNSFPDAQYDPAKYKREVRVFRRDGAYAQIATLRPGPYESREYANRSFFGEGLAISRNGEYIGVVDQHSTIPGLVEPPRTSPSPNASPHAGVYVFERNGASYRQRRHVGVTRQPPDLDDPVIGDIAFADGGKQLLIGHPRARSNGSGPGDGRENQSLTDAGAIWLY